MAEDLLDRLVAFVRKYYDDHHKALLLSRFGQLNKPLLDELKGTHGTLMAAVVAAGPDRLTVVDDRIGSESMAPTEFAKGAELTFQKDAAKEKESSSKFDSLPIAVQLAFCVRIEAGEHIALRVSPPFHYKKVSALEFIRPGFRAISEEYRKPGLNLKRASLQDREMLWEMFLAWTEKEKLDPAIFAETPNTNALGRLLAAQPPQIMNQIVIPADIAALLLRRP